MALIGNEDAIGWKFVLVQEFLVNVGRDVQDRVSEAENVALANEESTTGINS